MKIFISILMIMVAIGNIIGAYVWIDYFPLSLFPAFAGGALIRTYIVELMRELEK